MEDKKQLVRKVVCDFVCISVVGIPCLILYYAGKPFHRGFYCDDESIRYPFSESTVTSTMLYIYGISIPLLTVFIVEMLRFKEARGALTKENLLEYLWIVYNELVVFVFGALSSQFLTDIAKYTIGRMRPHFIDVCKPKDFNILCPNELNYRYVEEYECTQPDAHKMKEARLSFMSGHSSFSSYSMVYVAMYLHSRANWQTFYLLRPLLQVLAIHLSLFTGFSRISDYKHHWSDVLIGLLQGTLAAIITHCFVRDAVRVKELSDNNKHRAERRLEEGEHIRLTRPGGGIQ
ncbi:putative phosphatidate phosphatase [Halotydeus destructor]|nr:putative phosphatidate phosphatase [Halotydeus destructor]